MLPQAKFEECYSAMATRTKSTAVGVLEEVNQNLFWGFFVWGRLSLEVFVQGVFVWGICPGGALIPFAALSFPDIVASAITPLHLNGLIFE